MSYAERSRMLRRDVFGYDDWVNHRSTDRFIGNLLNMLNKSGIFRILLPEILKYTFIAVFVCLYNALLVTGYDDFVGVHHEAFASFPVCKLPAEFFSLTTPSLALLLGKFG